MSNTKQEINKLKFQDEFIRASKVRLFRGVRFADDKFSFSSHLEEEAGEKLANAIIDEIKEKLVRCEYMKAMEICEGVSEKYPKMLNDCLRVTANIVYVMVDLRGVGKEAEKYQDVLDEIKTKYPRIEHLMSADIALCKYMKEIHKCDVEFRVDAMPFCGMHSSTDRIVNKKYIRKQMAIFRKNYRKCPYYNEVFYELFVGYDKFIQKRKLSMSLQKIIETAKLIGVEGMQFHDRQYNRDVIMLAPVLNIIFMNRYDKWFLLSPMPCCE